jgi:Raf kinase inhibitor-like YbhB/YbcL family protein
VRAVALLLGALLTAGCDGGPPVQVPSPPAASAIAVTSTAFTDGGAIPTRHTCSGAGLSPPLAWSGVPSAARSLVLTVTDPDAPRGTFLHWLVFDIDPQVDGVSEGHVPEGGREAENTARRTGWFPPCPPSGTHRYVVTVYALDTTVRRGSSQHVLDVVARHTLASGTLRGLVSAR